MLHQPEITAYSLVEVYPDRIVVTGYGREESRILRG
jgi:hypothetical protein